MVNTRDRLSENYEIWSWVKLTLVQLTLHYDCSTHMFIISDNKLSNFRHCQNMVSMGYYKLGCLEPYQDILFNDCDRQR